MSAEYRPPTIDDDSDEDAPESLGNTVELDHALLASESTGGLAPGSMDTIPVPEKPSELGHCAGDGSQQHPMSAEDDSAIAGQRSRPRSATVRRTSSPPVSGLTTSPQKHKKAEKMMSADSDQVVADPDSSSDETIVQKIADENEESAERPISPSVVSTLTNFAALTGKARGSGSSSGSGSTITQSSWPRRRGSERSNQDDKSQHKGRYRSRSPRALQQHPNVLSYLEPDSPNVTSDTIQRSIEQSYWRVPDVMNYQSPSARSTSSSMASSSFQSDEFSDMAAGDHDTDRSSSPDHSAFGDSPVSAKFDAQMAVHQRQQQQLGYRNYGTPEMPRGSANLPHLPPNALQPRLAGAHHGHPKHLPRAEKLPLSGYELIASKLCAGDPDRSNIKPIYRRFEALNHRLLLHLQDELAELEEQLHRLDTADTQTRRLQNCILPASRRQEALTAGELQWHKTDVLGKIGYKLGQYNHVLSSFKDTQSLASPDLRDVEYYRAYLANRNPVVDIEARFLDPTEDLVSLARPSSSSSSDELRTPMPMPRNAMFPASGPSLDSQRSQNTFQGWSPLASSSYVPVLAAAFVAAFLLPILAFAVIPGFIGRMAVILLVAVGVALGVVQAGLFGVGMDRSAPQAATEGLLVSGVYVGVMAVVAGIFG